MLPPCRPPKGSFPMLNFSQKLQSNKICLNVLNQVQNTEAWEPFNLSTWLSTHTPPPSQSIDTINLLTPSNINHYISGGTLTPLTPLPMQEMKPSMFSPIIADSTAPFNTGK